MSAKRKPQSREDAEGLAEGLFEGFMECCCSTCGHHEDDCVCPPTVQGCGAVDAEPGRRSAKRRATA